MKKYQVILADGNVLTFDGASLMRDGLGVHIFDENEKMVATFNLDLVQSAYQIPVPDG